MYIAKEYHFLAPLQRCSYSQAVQGKKSHPSIKITVLNCSRCLSLFYDEHDGLLEIHCIRSNILRCSLSPCHKSHSEWLKQYQCNWCHNETLDLVLENDTTEMMVTQQMVFGSSFAIKNCDLFILRHQCLWGIGSVSHKRRKLNRSYKTIAMLAP